MSTYMVLKPRTSEKTYMLSQVRNSFTIDVPKNANKHTIAQAVEAQFKVTVESVNIVNVKGKVKRTVRRGGRAITGQRSDVKKAYIKLKAGDTLPFFAEAEDSSNKDKKDTKTKKGEEKK